MMASVSERLSVVRGEISYIEKGKVHGWAVAEDEQALEVDIHWNNQPVGTCLAKMLRPHLRAIGIARGGYVGFAMHIPDLKPGDHVQAQVAQTGQPLYGSKILIKKEHL